MAQNGRIPRGISTVIPYKRPDGEARCKVTLDSGEVVALHSLSRQEQLAAARVLYPECPGNAWMRMTGDLVQTLIRNGDPVAASEACAQYVNVKPRADKVAPEPLAAILNDPILILDEPYAAPAPQVGITSAEQALLDLLRGKGQSVDAEQVRTIVRAELQSVDVGVTRIEVTSPATQSVMTIDQPHAVFPEVLDLAMERENVLLVGPAGSGKSTIGEHVAQALGLPFGAISFGPTTPASKTFGFQNAAGEFVGTEAHRVYSGGGVLLLDELDNGHPGLVAELNQMLANGYAAFACGMVKRHPDTVIIATANTYGLGPDRMFVGRNILDAATLNRFWSVETPIDEALERSLALAYATDETLSKVRTWIDYVVDIRAKVYAQRLPVVVSPRDTVGGAKMIARRGWTLERCAERRIFAGLGGDVLAKLK